MKFVEKIKKLCDSYDLKQCGKKDRARLYGVYENTPPLAEHIVFEPMPTHIMQRMVDNYKLDFPKELLELFKNMNGAEFFWTIKYMGAKKIRIPVSKLTIYGIPITNEREHLEPFNISVEDLGRPKGTPEEWLKFGSYYRPERLSERLDLFANTKNGKVYAIEHDRENCCVEQEWDSIDECLCGIFDLLIEKESRM